MTAGVDWNAAAFEAHLRGIRERADAVARAAVAESAALVQSKAREYSTARPGPRIRSGAHHAGIVTEGPVHTGDSWEARVGPTKVYSRRLELGGGNWPPGLKFPYMERAVEWARGPVAEIFRRAWGRLHS